MFLASGALLALVALLFLILLVVGLARVWRARNDSDEKRWRERSRLSDVLPYLGALLGLAVWTNVLIAEGTDRLESHRVVVKVEAPFFVAAFEPPPLGTVRLSNVTEAGIVVEKRALDSFLADPATVEALDAVLSAIDDGNIAFDVEVSNRSSADVDHVVLRLQVEGQIRDLDRKRGAQNCGQAQFADARSSMRIDCELGSGDSARIGVLVVPTSREALEAKEILASIRNELPPTEIELTLEPSIPPLPQPKEAAVDADEQENGEEGGQTPADSEEPGADSGTETSEATLQPIVVLVYFLPSEITLTDLGLGLQFTQLDPRTLQVTVLFGSPDLKVTCVEAEGKRVRTRYDGLAATVESHDC
jgi:hypothetical protein